jgi:dolichol kinase
MTTRQTSELLSARDEIVAAPPRRACDDQSFELPTGIYVAMALLFAGFIAVLSIAFRGHMAVSFGVIFAFLAAFFAIPSLFPRMVRERRTTALQWHEFLDRGIQTATGRASARSATVLVLALPILIFCFAIAVALITWLV